MNTKTYVSRGGDKLESACLKFRLSFKDRNVLDIGSSTGGFSDYALKNGAKKVIAIELGSNQIDSRLRLDKRIELHEKTNILDVLPYGSKGQATILSFVPDIVVVDLSFVSLKDILPYVVKLVDANTKLIVLVKPQFEAKSNDKNHGIIKNETIRRSILKDTEHWIKEYFVIIDKIDSGVVGSKGNKERFYLLSRNINSK
jgi:23S rRNA (cytidine1920-2'-O)/16S rRNA (cytidine1409-2'-O)-methyltransferase